MTHKITPMMEQYISIRQANPSHVLFYRMGDFYELFFDDAIECSQIMDVHLTKRGKTDDTDIPMCGIPYHSSKTYIKKLLQANKTIAICEQIETPAEAKKRGSKIVRREVVKIITPGTVTDEYFTNEQEFNFITSLYIHNNNEVIFVFADVTVGDIYVREGSLDNLADEISRMNVSEIIISEKDHSLFKEKLESYENKFVIFQNIQFDYNRARRNVSRYYRTHNIDIIEKQLLAQHISCLGALFEYLDIVHKQNTPMMKYPEMMKQDHFLEIDTNSLKNLDLYPGQALYDVIDMTITPIGRRLLYKIVTMPLRDSLVINNRLDIVESYFHAQYFLKNIRDELSNVKDICKILSRLSTDILYHRDLIALKKSLITINEISLMFHFRNVSFPESYLETIQSVKNFENLVSLLEEAIIDEEIVADIRQGNCIRSSYNLQLSELREAVEDSMNYIQRLEKKYQLETNNDKLKISYNNMFGHFIEVKNNLARSMDKKFTHKQTLSNVTRFTTDELIQLDNQLSIAKDNLLRVEMEILHDVIDRIKLEADNIYMADQFIATLDFYTSIAYLAHKNDYTRPKVDNSDKFSIQGGRHPLIEKLLLSSNQRFIANDCDLSDNHTWLITGPNMAGKSTFLRQNAIITILAQAGFFVPAQDVHIGIRDKIFSRIGASDNLSLGQSTFMVEMIETGYILHNATKHSLVIVDEIGRGTSTEEGVSIAFATLDYLHNHLGAKTLFATHYHELTQRKFPQLELYFFSAYKNNDSIQFSYKIEEGAVQHSYALDVAKLAGLPKEAISIAEDYYNQIKNQS